jgi:ATP synthase protein I
MSDPGSNSGNRDAELKARLDKLSGAIKAEMVQADGDRKAAEARASDSGMGKAMATGFRVASELLAGVVVGAFIGWWIDRWLGSSPIAFLVLTLVGVVAGFWNVYRFAARPTGGGSDGGK